MASKIFKKVFERNIEQFVGHFSDDSSVIFKNEKDKLIHPGEYGKYREESCKQILRLLLNKHSSISDGFIITADDSITTQCDIIIYNSDISPIIADDISRMFPAEEVLGIIEVKSTLSKSQYIDALRKMAKNKQIIINGRKGEPITKYARTAKQYDTVGSFLICNKLDFDYESLSNEEIYGDIDRTYWHNSILSVEDCCITYILNFQTFPPILLEHLRKKEVNVNTTAAWPYSTFDCDVETVVNDENRVTIDTQDKYRHIKLFFINVVTCCQDIARYTYEPSRYLGMSVESIYDQHND